MARRSRTLPMTDEVRTMPFREMMRRYLPYLWPKGEPMLRARVVAAVLCVLAAKGALLAMPFFYKSVVDGMAEDVEGSARGEAVLLGIALVAGYILARFGSLLFDNLRKVVFERVGQEATRRISAQVFEHLHNLSLRFHLNRRTGALTKIVERGTKSIDMMLYFFMFNIAPTSIELIAVLVIFYIKFGTGVVLATLAMVVIYMTMTRIITDWRTKVRKQMNDLDTGAVGRAVDALLNYETVKYFNAEGIEAKRYESAVGQYARAAEKNENSLALLNVSQSFLTNLLMGAAMAYTVWGWGRGDFTTGDIVLVNTLLMQLFRPLDLLGIVYRSVRQGLIDMAALFDLLDTEPEILDAPDAPALVVTRGEVVFHDVHFGYDADRMILHGLDFRVPAGTTLAIVGPSGAGKSTIARLLFRFYDPSRGRIEIDGQDISEVTQHSLRAAIGIVPQDSVLFNDTIGYNVAYGRNDASQGEIEAAARGASLDTFIARLPDGYDTRVGERGLKLSGGEKQRVAIARTLLKNPPVLILDEATSALDSRTEDEIQSTLDDISGRQTTLMIAHRLSTIIHADHILVLDNGRVA